MLKRAGEYAQPRAHWALPSWSMLLPLKPGSMLSYCEGWLDRRALVVPRWAMPMAIASLAMLMVQSLDHRFVYSSPPLTLLLTGALLLLFVALYRALSQTRQAPMPAHQRLVTVGLLTALALNTALHIFLVLPHLAQPNRYSTDAATATDCATKMYITGRDPYRNIHPLTCMAEHGLGFDQTTPKQAGTFHTFRTYPKPGAYRQYILWKVYWRELGFELRNPHYASPEFETRFNYPGAAILLAMPAIIYGFRDLVPLYLGCAIVASILIYRRAAPRIRWLIGLLLVADTPLLLDEAGGTTDSLYGLLLVLYWLCRERALTAGALLGLAAATRQQAWFFVPFLLYLGWRTGGTADLQRRGWTALAVFLGCNLPFIVMGPGDWLTGILAPVLDPLFAQGVGLVALSIAGILPLFPELVFTALEVLAIVALFRLYMKRCLTAPGLAMFLPLVPMALAWRSLHTYFMLLPLLATAVLASRRDTLDAPQDSGDKPRALPAR